MGNDYGIFLGEVLASKFITGDDLAERIGLTAGTSQYSNTPWLKFLLNDELIYVPMTPIRDDVSWDDIYYAGAVYGSGDYGVTNPFSGICERSTQVEIDQFKFSVTLLRGADDDPTPNDAGYDKPWTHISEWNKLMYPIHGEGVVRTGLSVNNTPNERWASYSNLDLTGDCRSTAETYSWTQETYGEGSGNRLVRGHHVLVRIYSCFSNTPVNN